MIRHGRWLVFCLLCQTAVAAEPDPLNSPQWEAMHTRFLNGEPYTFDSKVTVEAPPEAEDSLNVPIALRVTDLQGIQEMRVFADLNPLPQVLNFAPKPSPRTLPSA